MGRDGIFTKSSRRDKVRSCEIRKAPNVEPLLWMERLKIPWFKHVTRIPQERLAGQVLLTTPTGKWPRGRPRTRWSDCISGLVWRRLGVEPAEISEIAVGREILRVLGLLPSGFPEMKAVVKMDEKMAFLNVWFHNSSVPVVIFLNELSWRTLRQVERNAYNYIPHFADVHW